MKEILKNRLPKEANPFVDEHFRVKVRVLTDFKDLVNIGTSMSPEKLPKEYYQEQEPHTKIFRSAQHRDAILGLNPAAKDLWIWIMMTIDYNRHSIDINKKLFIKRSGLTVRSYSRAVNELVSEGFIFKSSIPSVYHVNPRLIFFGSRPNTFPDHRQQV